MYQQDPQQDPQDPQHAVLALELRQTFIVGSCVLALRHHFATSRDVVMGLVNGRHDQSAGLVVLGVLGKGAWIDRIERTR